jgi:hypothetical protein
MSHALSTTLRGQRSTAIEAQTAHLCLFQLSFPKPWIKPLPSFPGTF